MCTLRTLPLMPDTVQIIIRKSCCCYCHHQKVLEGRQGEEGDRQLGLWGLVGGQIILTPKNSNQGNSIFALVGNSIFALVLAMILEFLNEKITKLSGMACTYEGVRYHKFLTSTRDTIKLFEFQTFIPSLINWEGINLLSFSLRDPRATNGI